MNNEYTPAKDAQDTATFALASLGSPTAGTAITSVSSDTSKSLFADAERNRSPIILNQEFAGLSVAMTGSLTYTRETMARYVQD